MKKFTVFVLASLLLISSAMAASGGVGSSGAQFLKIGVGSRYQAMGEASVAVSNDVYSMYWNPAGLAEIENSSVSFTNVNWLLDVDLNYVGFARYFEDVGVFGVSAAVLSMGDVEITTVEEQDGTGRFWSASSYTVGMSFARQLTNRFAFGGSVKYVGEKIYNLRSGAFAFDFGTMLHIGYRSLRMGMSITNMGPDLQFSGSDLNVGYDGGLSQRNPSDPAYGAELKTTPYSMPMTFRVGMAYDFEMNPYSILTLSGELKHPNDQIQQGSIGAQAAFKEKFFLRGGYKFNYDEEGLALGGGFDTPISGDTRLQIDYAWQDFGRLNSAQRFSIGFTF
ncbi:MAG: PorV/PorQ family protein [bacterium]|nr:PorV/PorQ family protein [bacterium]